jgi:hypothetical protein
MLPAANAASASASDAERRWDAAVELAAADLSALEESAVGVGVRLSFRAARWVALDAGVGLAPADLGDPPFSASQAELLAGVRIGPSPRPWGGYLGLRAGFVRYAAAPEPIACIAIFPPPLACELSAGATPLAVQLGAGFERLLGSRGLIRVEIGDRIVRLPGPSFDAGGEARFEDFWSHEPRLGVSLALRF